MILREFIRIEYNILLAFSLLPSMSLCLILSLLGLGLLVFTQAVQSHYLLFP